MNPLTAGSVGGFIVGGTIGFIDSIQDSISGIEKAEEQLKYIKEMYELNTKGVNESFAKTKEEATRSANFALTRADITDITQDVSERQVSANFNANIDQLYLSQIEDNMNWNAQLRAMGQSEGGTLAALAGSGIRAGSSLSQAVEMEAATNQAQLQFSQEAKRRSDENNLGVMLANLAGAKVDIYGNRVSADITRDEANYLKASYEIGGHNYNLYQNKLETLTSQYNYNKKQIQSYLRDTRQNWFTNAIKSFFTMGAAGASTGYTLTKMGVELGGYNSTVNSSAQAKTVRDVTPKIIGMR